MYLKQKRIFGDSDGNFVEAADQNTRPSFHLFVSTRGPLQNVVTLGEARHPSATRSNPRRPHHPWCKLLDRHLGRASGSRAELPGLVVV
jgi:hypothetical protein